jgi:hypothetical protein
MLIILEVSEVGAKSMSTRAFKWKETMKRDKKKERKGWSDFQCFQSIWFCPWPYPLLLEINVFLVNVIWSFDK